MDLCTEIIFTDPVLQRAILDARRFAPMWGHDATVNNALYEISALTVLLQKAKEVQFAESLQKQIRRQYFLARDHSDGYYIDMPGNHDDGCEHVVMFEHRNDDDFFDIDFRKRAELRHRYKFREKVQARHRPRRTRSV